MKSYNQLYGKKPGVVDHSFKYQYFKDAFRPITPIAPANESQGIYMPNAFTQKLQLIRLQNNGNGFSLYQSTPDNMFVLRPDSTFYSAMPVK